MQRQTRARETPLHHGQDATSARVAAARSAESAGSSAAEHRAAERPGAAPRAADGQLAAVARTRRDDVWAEQSYYVGPPAEVVWAGLVRSGIAQNALVLPSQWMVDAVTEGPERKLFAALVLGALHDLRPIGAMVNPEIATWRTIKQQKARRWIEDLDGREASYPVTFRTAIELGFPRLDADAMREAILKSPVLPVQRLNFVSAPFARMRVRYATKVIGARYRPSDHR